ncbi:MAG TPA: ABC transporter ATP-binding protein [Thermomicrobiales bacterium]|nr:ABC transporter ATP-binding protein [Thermomicrobiales bacterium]
MANLVLRNVVKEFGEVRAVDRVSLDIEDGEFVALVGPSGCGKTTTLNMLAGLEEVTDGTISIDGRVVNDLDPKDRDIAMVFQNYALYPNKTVYENLAFPLKMKKMPKADIDTRVRETAEVLSITPLLGRRPRELSGGQQQRVALGRALVRNPKVFLMDEPLSNLDAKLRVQMRTELKRFHQDLGATIIYVTHDQLEAMTMADKIAVMSGGVLQQFGKPDEIFNRPNNVFVASFIGSPSMNLMRGSVQDSNGRLEASGSGWRSSLPDRLAGEVSRGQEVALGIRPSNILVSHDPIEDGFSVQVLTVEPTGDLTFLTCRAGSTDIITIVSPDFRVAPSDVLHIAFDSNHVHLFDGESERAIRPGVGARRVAAASA